MSGDFERRVHIRQNFPQQSRIVSFKVPTFQALYTRQKTSKLSYYSTLIILVPPLCFNTHLNRYCDHILSSSSSPPLTPAKCNKRSDSSPPPLPSRSQISKMARRSTRLSTNQVSPHTTNTTTKKRTAPTASATSTPRATKAAKRTSAVNGSAKTTPKTSQHFPKREYDDATGLTSSSEDLDGDDDGASDAGSDFAAAAAESAVEVMSEPSSEEALESESEEVKPRGGKGGKGGMGKGKGTGLVVRSKGKGEALPAPGTEVVIKKPKARGAGGTAYEDRRVHPNTLEFLGELRRNNEREWLKSEFCLRLIRVGVELGHGTLGQNEEDGDWHGLKD